MKKLLLLGVAAACTLPMMAKEDGHAISLEWMNTSLQSNSSNMRSMALSDGVMYIPNVATKKIEMWKDNAKIGDMPVDGTPMACFNISVDDAKNIIVSMRDWAASPGIANGFAAPNDKLFIMSADGSKKTVVNKNGALPSTRSDLFGHTRGDVFSEEGGSIFVSGTNGYAINFVELIIANGEVVASYPYQVDGAELPDGLNDNVACKTPSPYLDGLSIDEYMGGNRNSTITTPTTAFLSGYNMLGEEQFAALLPHMHVTSQYATFNPFCDGEMGMGNSVFIMELGDDEAYHVANKYYRMPQHNACTSFDLFELGGKQFILYPAGSNNCDGWAIAEADLVDTPQSDKDDVEYLVCRKYAETADDGSILYTTVPVGYTNAMFAEVSATEDKVVYVYQYTPGAYMAKYKVDLTNWFEEGSGSVEGVANDIDDVDVCGGKGFINVNGGEVSIYTVGGALIAKTSENISVAPGLYIANTGKRTVKVVVK